MTSCDSHMTVTCFIPGCVDKFVQHLHSQKRLDVTWYAGCVQVIAGMGGRTHAVKAHFPSLPSPPFPFLPPSLLLSSPCLRLPVNVVACCHVQGSLEVFFNLIVMDLTVKGQHLSGHLQVM